MLIALSAGRIVSQTCHFGIRVVILLL